MFEFLPSRESLADVDDGSVVTAIEACARAEAAAAAARLAAIAELTERRLTDGVDEERGLWACDGWDSAAAEIAAALGLSHRRASGQMHLARDLHDRLPLITALLAAGDITLRTASTIAWRTHLVDSTEAMATIDSALAARAAAWGPLSDKQLDVAIDAVLEQHDPDARRAFQAAARGRDIQFGKPEDSTGTASVWGRLYSTDAALFERRIRELTRDVCANDPRTQGERRADAVGAWVAGSDQLACRCGNSECRSAGTDSRAGSVVIHVVADERAVEAAEAGTTDRRSFRAAVLQGGGIVPGPLLTELVNAGALIKPLTALAPAADPRYHPSVKLAAFIRSRDMHCRFPGCNVPAAHCDIDHTVAYPSGPTHPSNLKCVCRKHHLLKTFWIGPNGWRDEQQPDGSVIWTSPSGKTYTTHPGSRVVFPRWNTTTAALPATEPGVAHINRGLQMPRRKRTRRAEQAQRIKAARTHRDTG